jgi:hypothetical protein
MRIIRPVWFTRADAESCPIERMEDCAAKHGRVPDAYGVYRVEDDGTQEHEADYPTLVAAHLGKDGETP